MIVKWEQTVEPVFARQEQTTEYTEQALSFAAEELNGYLEKTVTGFDSLQGTIWLKIQERPGNDWFRIHIGEAGGTIAGNSCRAVLLGVYRYLHQIGCRFLAPGRDREFLPAIRPENMAVMTEEEASFYHRGVCIEGADSFENIRDYIDWLPKIGCNSFFMQFKSPYGFLARWYHHLENPFREPEAYTEADALEHMGQLDEEMGKRGLLVHRCGHGWTGETLGYQTVNWNTVKRPLEKSRYAWTAQVNGRRGLYMGIPANTNLCHANEEATKAFVSLVVEYARQQPQMNYLHIWLADEYNNVCECPECSRTTLSDQYVELLNRIDEALEKEGLETRVVFLLYQELLWPPVQKRLNNPDRFVMMFAPISRTFEAPYQLAEDGQGEKERQPADQASRMKPPVKLPVYRRNHIELPVDLQENLSFLYAWQQIFAGDSFIYDYPLGRAHYGDFGYVHMAKIIAEDIGKLSQMGLNGYISCQELRAGLPNSLPGYVMGHLLWDSGQSFETLVNEYFEAAYGSEYRRVREYLQKLSDRDACDYINGKGQRCREDMAEQMRDIQRICEDFCPETEGLMPGENGEMQKRFWHLLAYHRNYVLLLAQAIEHLASGETEAASHSWRGFRELICRHEPTFQKELDVYRVLEVTKKYTGFCE